MPPNYPPRKKKHVFFVDTKTTCFLCLQEVPPDPVPLPTILLNENDDDDGVELKLLEARKTQNERTKIEEKEGFCLRSIFKLLQMDAGKVLSKKLTGGPFLGSNLVNTDLSVVLCKTCYQVTKQLTSLFREWELLQMRMDYAVRNFTEILANSERDPNQMEQLRRNLIDPLDLLQVSVAELIRKEALNRSRKYLRKSWPKVNIVSGTKNRDATSAPVVCRNLSTKVVTAQPAKVQEYSTPNITLPTRTTAINIKELLLSMPRIKVEDEHGVILCGLCSSQSRNENFTEDELKKHVFAYHPNYIFASVKRPGCSDVKFQELCEKVLKNELIQLAANESPPDIEGGVSIFNCTYCTSKYHDIWDMSTHIVENHFGVYECKLMELQLKCSSDGDRTVTVVNSLTDSNGKESLPTRESVWDSAKYPHYCEDCGKRFTSHSYLYRHKKYSCPKNRCTPPTTEPFHCQNCGRGFKVKYNMLRHKKHTCPKNDARGIYGCQNPECDKSFSTRQNMMYHYKNTCPYRYHEHSRSTSTTANTLNDTPASPTTATHAVNCYSSRRPTKNRPISNPATRAPSITSAVRAASQLSNENGETASSQDTSSSSHHHHHDQLRSQSAKNDHETQSSNVGNPSVYPCQSCKAEFLLHSKLLEHTSKYHVKQVGPDGKTSGRCKCGGFYPDLQDHIKHQNCSAHRVVVYKNTVECEYCGIKLLGPTIRRHKEICSMAPKTATETVIHEVNTQTPLPEETDFNKDEEEELVELGQGSCVFNTKIEVLEPSPVNVFRTPRLEGEAMIMPERLLTGELSDVPEEGNENMECTDSFSTKQEDDVDAESAMTYNDDLFQF